MNDKSSFIENYKEYLFYLYNLGQVKRKKNISSIIQLDYDRISLEIKRKLEFLFNKLKRDTLEIDCMKCNEKINKDPFILCDSCYEIFHKRHVKPENNVVKCVNCDNRLKKIKIFDNEIYISSDKIVRNDIDITKIELHF